ncbi:MAG TPA: hypothetical protein VNX28_16190 [Gemmataceae bacterium]|nr:hypothetical protein [Gemmataceae bacterium]
MSTSVKTGGDPPDWKPPRRNRRCEDRFMRRLGRLLGVIDATRGKIEHTYPRAADDLAGLYYLIDRLSDVITANLVRPPRAQEQLRHQCWAESREMSLPRLRHFFFVVRRAAREVFRVHTRECRCGLCFEVCQVHWILVHAGWSLARVIRKGAKPS